MSTERHRQSTSAVAILAMVASRHLSPLILSAAASEAFSLSSSSSSPTFLPAWDEIQLSLSSSLRHAPPTVIDGSLQPNKRPAYPSDRPTLFRERHGWCPYSERVWLTLECLEVEHDTVLIDNTGHGARPSYFGGQTPQVRWGDGRTQGESLDLIDAIDKQYHNSKSNWLRPDDMANEVQSKIDQFLKIFPSKSRPSSRAAFLFGYNGEPLWKSEFERVLSESNDLLGTTSTSGPFFCGDRFTAADVAWAPFLERYGAQLPCLHDGLDPRDGRSYPHLAAWYDAMETQVASYGCRIRGDASSWRKVLTMAGYGNMGAPPDVGERILRLEEEERRRLVETTDEEGTRPRRQVEQILWDEYRATRPHLAATPGAEAGAVLTKNREAVARDVRKRAERFGEGDGVPLDEGGLDDAMRALATILIGGEGDGNAHYDAIGDSVGEARNVQGIGPLSSFLDRRMCIPRDMGAMSAAAIKRIAAEMDK